MRPISSVIPVSQATRIRRLTSAEFAAVDGQRVPAAERYRWEAQPGAGLALNTGAAAVEAAGLVSRPKRRLQGSALLGPNQVGLSSMFRQHRRRRHASSNENERVSATIDALYTDLHLRVRERIGNSCTSRPTRPENHEQPVCPLAGQEACEVGQAPALAQFRNSAVKGVREHTHPSQWSPRTRTPFPGDPTKYRGPQKKPGSVKARR